MSLGVAWCAGCQHWRIVRRTAGRGRLAVRRHRMGEGLPDCPGSGRLLAGGERTQELVKHRAADAAEHGEET